MDSFWPTLPFLTPASQGLPLWWAITWWLFQIIVMVGILWTVTRWALKMDRVINHLPGKSKVTVDESGQSLDS